jgi:hypothetical protein
MLRAITIVLSLIVVFCLGILVGRWFAEKEQEATRKTEEWIQTHTEESGKERKRRFLRLVGRGGRGK